MVQRLLGQKKAMRQVWTADGRRMAVTEVLVKGNAVVRQVAQPEGKEDVNKVQIAFGTKKMKNLNNAQRQQLTQAGIQEGKRWYAEILADQQLQPGQDLLAQEVFQIGEVVKVTGTIKGRGFAGVMKRHGFKGGKRTHGQSDRERAPGSIGNRTTPGRVFKGKRMPGHYGDTTETLEDRVIVAINPVTQSVWVRGTLPGAVNGLLTLEKQNKQDKIALPEESLRLLDIMAEAEVVAEESPEVPETISDENAPETPDEAEAEPADRKPEEPIESTDHEVTETAEVAPEEKPAEPEAESTEKPEENA